MEFTQFVSYLDYGVLGLSAIILILSFVLLSREQKREVFRPEVAKAIRRYMMLALAFAGVGLVSTVVDGFMVQPTKAERKQNEEREELLSDMLAREMQRRVEEVSFDGEIEEEVAPVDEKDIDSDAAPRSDEEASDEAEGNEGESAPSDTAEELVPVRGESPPADLIEKQMREIITEDAFHVKSDRKLFDAGLDKAGKLNNEIEKNKARIVDVYDEVIKLEEN